MVRPLWALAGPALGALLAAGLLTAPVGPLTSTVQHDFDLSTASVTATLIAPYVVAVLALVAPGYLLGRRWPTATGVPALVLLVVGSALCAFPPVAALLAVGRLVAGLGAGTVLGVALALSGQVGGWRTRARLVLGPALGAALLLGPVVSGVLAVMLSWRLTFMLDVALAVIALAAAAATGIATAALRPSHPNPPPGT